MRIQKASKGVGLLAQLGQDAGLPQVLVRGQVEYGHGFWGNLAPLWARKVYRCGAGRMGLVGELAWVRILEERWKCPSRC